MISVFPSHVIQPSLVYLFSIGMRYKNNFVTPISFPWIVKAYLCTFEFKKKWKKRKQTKTKVLSIIIIYASFRPLIHNLRFIHDDSDENEEYSLSKKRLPFSGQTKYFIRVNKVTFSFFLSSTRKNFSYLFASLCRPFLSV